MSVIASCPLGDQEFLNVIATEASRDLSSQINVVAERLQATLNAEQKELYSQLEELTFLEMGAVQRSTAERILSHRCAGSCQRGA